MITHTQHCGHGQRPFRSDFVAGAVKRSTVDVRFQKFEPKLRIGILMLSLEMRLLRNTLGRAARCES